MRRHANVDRASYLAHYGAQLGALGQAAQLRLQRSAVLIVGAGGLGTAVGVTLAMVGIGKIVVVDPQSFAPDNFNRSPFARARDIGRPKVDALASFFEGRPHLTVVPIVGRAESLESIREALDVDLVVACSNTVASRLATARFGCRRALPQVSASVIDGRHGFGGFVVVSCPGRRELACPACFLTSQTNLLRGESLVAPVVSAVGAIAAWSAIRLLIRSHRKREVDSNCLTIDLERSMIEPLRVLRRLDCSACSRNRNKPRSIKRP